MHSSMWWMSLVTIKYYNYARTKYDSWESGYPTMRIGFIKLNELQNVEGNCIAHLKTSNLTTAVEASQRRIQHPVKHLRWSYFGK